MVTVNLLESSGFHFGGIIIFNKKYITNMEKFTTTGLSSNIIFSGATFKKGDMKRRIIGSIQVDITLIIIGAGEHLLRSW